MDDEVEDTCAAQNRSDPVAGADVASLRGVSFRPWKSSLWESPHPWILQRIRWRSLQFLEAHSFFKQRKHNRRSLTISTLFSIVASQSFSQDDVGCRRRQTSHSIFSSFSHWPYEAESSVISLYISEFRSIWRSLLPKGSIVDKMRIWLFNINIRSSNFNWVPSRSWAFPNFFQKRIDICSRRDSTIMRRMSFESKFESSPRRYVK